MLNDAASSSGDTTSWIMQAPSYGYTQPKAESTATVTRLPSKSLGRVQSIESNVSSQGRRRSIGLDAIEDSYADEESLEIKSSKSRLPSKAPCCMAVLAHNWNLPLEVVRPSADLFKQHAVFPGSAKDEDILRDGILHYDELLQIVLKLNNVRSVEDLTSEMLSDVKKETTPSREHPNGIVDFREFVLWYQQHAFLPCVNLTEYERHLRAIALKLDIEFADMDHYKDLFDKFDLDSNGGIDMHEFDKLLHALMKAPDNLRIPDSRIMHFWHECDIDGDGTVNLEEFATFYVKNFSTDSSNPMEEFYKNIRHDCTFPH